MRLHLCLGRALSVLISIFFFHAAEARWATVGDLPSVTEFDRTDVHVDAQGRTRIVREFQLRINDDNGREKESVQSIPFNARAQKLKILAARTINGSKVQDVARKNIEYKEVGDFTRSFDAVKQATLTYPNVQVGSKIYLKYELDNHEIALPGFFSLAFDFGMEFTENFSARIQSALPLYHWTSDPDQLFDIKSTKVGKNYLLEMQSKAPIVRLVAQEEESFIRPDRSPIIAVSSLQDWASYGKAVIPKHEALLARPLPEVLEKIRSESARETTTIAKLQRVTALISQEFRYFGDWRRRNGGYIPRSLAEIAESHYGDCKDLSLITAAVYRALGLKADLAWVYRGEIPVMRGAYTLPVDVLFNHAIVRVEADGRSYWIDATNPVSFANTAFTDIANRPAFVLSKTKPGLEEIPALTSESSYNETNLVYELQPDRTLKVQGEVSLAGRSAIGMTIKGFYNPVESVNYELIRLLAMNGKVLESSVGDFERRSRIVGDLKIPVRFGLSDIGLRTSAGFGFPLMREDVVSHLITDVRDRVSDIYMDTPSVSRTNVEITGVKRVGDETLDCDLKSEWIHLSRAVSNTARGVRIDDRIEVLAPVIPNERLQTKEFANFQDAARNCFNRAAVILAPR